MAIKNFANQMTADVAAGLNSKDARRLPQRVWKAAQRKLDALGAATTLHDLKGKGYELHELKRNAPGTYAIKVNDQYRIIFKFENGEALNVEITDYHD